MKILIHRDRDALTDTEMEMIRASYTHSDIEAWLPETWDIEHYFCSPEILAGLRNTSTEEAMTELQAIVTRRQIVFRQNFDKVRRTINEELYPGGGSPVSDRVWNEFQASSPLRVKGKMLMNEIINSNQSAVDRSTLVRTAIDGELASDLRGKLREMLG